MSLSRRYTFPEHELAVGKIAKEIGFRHVSLSSQLLPMIKVRPSLTPRRVLS